MGVGVLRLRSCFSSRISYSAQDDILCRAPASSSTTSRSRRHADNGSLALQSAHSSGTSWLEALMPGFGFSDLTFYAGHPHLRQQLHGHVVTPTTARLRYNPLIAQVQAGWRHLCRISDFPSLPSRSSSLSSTCSVPSRFLASMNVV